MPDTDPNLPKETEQPKPEGPKPEETPAAPAIDYEKKFAESSRENQILQEKLKAQEAARQELTKEPTDSDLRTAFPDWDTLDDFQKNIARRTYNSERIATRAAQTTEQLAQERAWNTSIELAVSSNTSLQGKEQAFRQYASKPQYRNVPMEVLVDAFLQKNGGEPPKPTPKPGLEPGSGGPRTPEKPKTLSAEDLALLRTSNPKGYQDYLKMHDLSDIGA